MKRFLKISTFLLALAPVAIGQDTVDTVPQVRMTADGAWPFVCKGGPPMEATLSAVPGRDKLTFSISFRKGTKPSGRKGENLEPGTCSWIDRGMSADEASTIQEEIPPPTVIYRLNKDGNVEIQHYDIPLNFLIYPETVQYLMVKSEAGRLRPRLNPFNGNRLLTMINTR